MIAPRPAAAFWPVLVMCANDHLPVSVAYPRLQAEARMACVHLTFSDWMEIGRLYGLAITAHRQWEALPVQDRLWAFWQQVAAWAAPGADLP